MSILLDSLRKSEAQRNIGETPSIHSTQQYDSRGKRGSGWLVWLLVGLTAMAIAWFGWRQYGVFEDTESLSGAEEGQPTAEIAEGRPSAAQAPRESEAVQGRRTPVEQYTQAPGREEAGPAADQPDSGKTTPSPAERVAEYAASIRDDENADPGNPGPADAESEAETASGLRTALQEAIAAQAEAQGRLSNTQSDEADVEDEEPGVVDTRQSVGRAAEESRQSQPQSYWQLPQRVRDDLPEFKITVLVFAENPEDRFLLMNGERFQEQDELEGGLVLEEIRRDGAVFAYGSRSFLVKN